MHNITDPHRPFLDSISFQVSAIHIDAAGNRLLKSTNQLRQCALAGSVTSHDTDHLSFMDRKIHILQGSFIRSVTEFQILNPKQFLSVLFTMYTGSQHVIPAAYFLLIFLAKHQAAHMFRMHGFSDLNPGITECRQIQRFSDSMLQEQIAGKKLRHRHISYDPTLIHQHDSVHSAPQYVFQPVFNDQYCGAGTLMDHVYQFYGSTPCGGIQIRQRLIKQQHLNILHHDPCQTDTLFLSTGQLMRRILKMMIDVHQSGHSADQLLHLILRHTIVFRGKGDILSHRQSDKLSVSILQYGAHRVA